MMVQERRPFFRGGEVIFGEMSSLVEQNLAARIGEAKGVLLQAKKRGGIVLEAVGRFGFRMVRGFGKTDGFVGPCVADSTVCVRI